MYRAMGLACLGLVARAAPVHADGEVHLRSAYYKEKATRVVQPMADIQWEVDPDLRIDAHLLVDSITSASAASGAGNVAFTESRFEGGAGIDYALDSYRLGVFGRYSNEPDYKSIFGGLRASAELGQKNTIVSLALGMGTDDISNAGAQDGGLVQPIPIEGELTSLLSSVSFSQIMSRLVVVGLTYDLSYLSGFQENPYRPVFGAGMVATERVPDARLRHACFGSVRGFLPGTRSTLVAGYRFYMDDWDLMAHTPEVRLIQELDPEVHLHLRVRYHRQTGTYFYKPLYETLDPVIEPYVTEDIKLSPFTSQAYGIKLESALAKLGARGAAGKVRFDVLFEYVVQHNRYGNAVVVQTGLTIPFGN